MPTSKWVVTPGTKQEILNRFKNFLKSYTDAKGNRLYMERIRRMCEGWNLELFFIYRDTLYLLQLFTIKYINFRKSVSY